MIFTPFFYGMNRGELVIVAIIRVETPTHATTQRIAHELHIYNSDLYVKVTKLYSLHSA